MASQARAATSIRTVDELFLWRSELAFPLLPRAGGSIEIEIPGIPHQERQEITAGLNRNAATCGCGSGKVAVLATLVGFGLWALLTRAPVDGRLLAIGLGALAAAASLGKATALVASRVRLDALVRKAARLAGGA